MRDRSRVGLVLLLGGVSWACGDSGGGGPVDPPDPTADLAATATGPASAAVGGSFVVTVAVANAGPAAAADVALVADLPASASVVSAPGASVDGGRATWSIGSLAAGASASRALTLSPSGPGAVSVTASAASATPDPTPGNNDGSAAAAKATTTVVVQADVRVTVSGPGVRLPGQDATWTVTVQNLGPSRATAVDAVLAFGGAPSGLSAGAGGTVAGDTVSWPAIAGLDAGASVVLSATAPTPVVGPIGARASAVSATADPSVANNDGSLPAAAGALIVGFAPVRTIQGEAPGDEYGWLMDVVGDLDGDGFAEFVVGAPANDAGGADAGRAYVVSAATGATLFTFTGDRSGERLGHAVDGAGDVDDDGVPDVVVGAPFSSRGRVFVFSGADGSLLHEIEGENAGDQFGSAVAMLGDVDADGHDDFLATAPGHDGGLANSGRVYVLSGATGAVLATMSSAAGSSGFGSSVGGVGDLTGDGIPDFGVGAPSIGAGRLYVLNGVTADTVFFSVPADGTGGAMGQFWLNSPGDVNGDAVPDIYVADILDSEGGSQAGKAYIVSGADGAKLARVAGESAGDQFGIGRGIPDVTGDGKGDLFVAAWLSDEAAPNAGKAYVISGADGTIVRTFSSAVGNENLGFDAIGIGDVTGDGRADFLISGGISPSSPGRVYVVAGLP